jgi:hypothetical protein
MTHLLHLLLAGFLHPLLPPLHLLVVSLPLGPLCCKLGLQYLIPILEYKATICKCQWTTDKTEIKSIILNMIFIFSHLAQPTVNNTLHV